MFNQETVHSLPQDNLTATRPQHLQNSSKFEMKTGLTEESCRVTGTAVTMATVNNKHARNQKNSTKLVSFSAPLTAPPNVFS